MPPADHTPNPVFEPARHELLCLLELKRFDDQLFHDLLRQNIARRQWLILTGCIHLDGFEHCINVTLQDHTVIDDSHDLVKFLRGSNAAGSQAP